MKHYIKIYPVGNGDTSQIILDNGKRILFDYRHLKKTENEEGPEINLKEQLKQELKDAKKTSFNVVAFTHNDEDHIENSTDFFELQHSKTYQGEDRIKIDTLWVPAAMILETAPNDKQSSEFIIWRQEARYRLKEGEGIRVFSKPDKLKDWLEENDLTVESRRHLITDAGEIVPEFSLAKDGIEFFCHSPFIKHVDEGEDLRNEAALVFNVRLTAGKNYYDYLAVGDSEWEVMEDIVKITKKNGNGDRLNWDLYNIPHHCSYKALSDEKGKDETVPKDKIKELLLAGKEGAYLISSSNPIIDNEETRKQKQPPHIQARKCYERYLKIVGGCKFLVTMEESSPSNPNPIEFEVGENGIILVTVAVTSANVITSQRAPRVG